MLELLLASAATMSLSTVADDGLSRGTPLLPPMLAREAAANAVYGGPTPATIFVNFDGATLNDSGEDSRTNSTLIGYSGPFDRYGEGAKRAAVLQAVREDWRPYAATVTDRRPDSGDYTMVMVGPTNFTGSSLGIALLDCANSWTSNNIVYAFHSADDGYTAAATATTINQEVAHSFGLEHVDAPEDIMHPYNVGGDPRFISECEDVVEAAGIGILCTDQHEASCGSPTRQNSHAELMRFLGPRPVDLMPPTVDVVSPESGTRFAAGDPFVISVEASDDEGVVAVELHHLGQMMALDDAPPYSWEVTGAPEGMYVFNAVAYDAAGNSSSSRDVVIYVGDVAEDTSDAPGGETDGDETDGADTFDIGSTGDDGLPDDDGDEPSNGSGFDPSEIPPGEDPFDPFGEGCDCRQGGGSRGAAGWLLMLAVLGLRRRR